MKTSLIDLMATQKPPGTSVAEYNFCSSGGKPTRTLVWTEGGVSGAIFHMTRGPQKTNIKNFLDQIGIPPRMTVYGQAMRRSGGIELWTCGKGPERLFLGTVSNVEPESRRGHIAWNNILWGLNVR